MFTIETLNNISAKGLELLPDDNFEVTASAENPDGVLVRSANMHDSELPESLLAIARAGAGTNNIPIDKASERGIVVFNTPGANANAVKELVLAGMVLSGRNIIDGIAWVNSLEGEGDDVPALVEKGKSRFVGPELAGKTLGVIGLGAIGVKVASMGTRLGMKVLGYDPYISVDSAWQLARSVEHCENISDIIANADYISLHLPVNEHTKHFIGKEELTQVKEGVRIMNFARGGLVDIDALLPALENGRASCYVTDFPTAQLINQPGVICIPHLGASTPESEDNCARMAAQQLRDYLVNGNVLNSVNLPTVSAPRNGGSRFCIIHQNVKGVLAGITNAMNNDGVNIDNMINRSKGDIAYTIIDIADAPSDALVEKVSAVEKIIRLRIL